MHDLSRIPLATLAAWCADGRLSEIDLEAEWTRRNLSRTSRGAPKPPPARRRPTSPDRAASRARRRSIAGAGWLPPRLLAHLTTAQAATLGVVAREVAAHGACTLPLDQIAALAGVCRSSAKSAIRAALALGILSRRLRPRRGLRSDTSVLMIISEEWATWLRIGGKSPAPTYPLDLMRGDRVRRFSIPRAPYRAERSTRRAE